MKLIVQNLSNTKVTLNSRLGTLMPHQTKEFLVTVEDIEKLAGRLQALEVVGSITWDTEDNPLQDDRTEGATVSDVGGSGGGSSSGSFVFRPGGTESGNVYTTWASLNTAVSATQGAKIVYIDGSQSLAVIDANFDIHGWDIRGYNDNFTPLLVENNRTMSFGVGGNKNITLRNISMIVIGEFPAFVSEGGDPLNVTLYNSHLEGAGEGGGGSLIQSSGNSTVNLTLRDGSQLRALAVSMADFCNTFVNIFDTSSINSENAFSGIVDSYLYVYLNSHLADADPQVNFIDNGGQVVVDGVRTNHLLPINDSQTGTTEKLVASFWLNSNCFIRAQSKALIGGSTITQGATLRIKPFSDNGVTLCEFTVENSTLASTEVVGGADVYVENEDWYEIYLSGNDIGDTALVTGLYISLIGA